MKGTRKAEGGERNSESMTFRLGDVAEMNPRGDLSHLSDNTVVGFVPMSAVSEITKTISSPETRRFGDVRKGYTPMRNGDVIVAKITPCFENGKLAIVDLDQPFAFGSTEFHVFRPNGQVDSRLLYHLLSSELIQKEGRNQMKGAAGQKRVPSDFFRAFEFRVPHSLPEQKRIASILDKADAIRRKLQQSLRLSDDFLRSVFLDMFGSDKSPKCERVPLGPFLEFMTSGGRGWSQYYAPSGARFIRSLDVQMNKIGEKDVAYVAAPNNAEAKRTRVQENDVLLTITGSLIGRVARIPKEHAGAYISQHVAILRLGKGLDPEYLARFLSMDEGQRLVQKSQYGQTKPGLNFDQIRRFTVPLPSTTLQKRFVDIANRVTASSMKSRAFMSDSETLFSSLQQRAFRGEL